MNEEITATMTYEVRSMMPALRWHNHRHNRKMLIVGTVALLILGFYFLAQRTGGNLILSRTTALMVAGAIVVMLLSRWIGHSAYARSIRSSPSNGKPLTFLINPEGVKVVLPEATADYAWSFFLSSLVTPDGVLLYTQKLAFNWVPKSAFASELEYSRFLELVAAKTKHSKVG